MNGEKDALKAVFSNDAADGVTGKQFLNDTEKVTVYFKKSAAVQT